MILYIAEKPSLGRAVASALPRPHKNGDGFITVGNGDVVSWCIGHLLEQAQPEAYNAEFKKWSTAHLPIVPEQWKLEIKPKTRKQFTVLKKLIKQADVLVNVGDPDREGQILIDEVINHCKVPKAKLQATQRCLISDLNTAAVKKSLNNLRSNTEFVPLATSALARARADWLYGINLTRLCTLKGQQSGFQGVLSVGRVQTPLLGLVVHRDLEIENFVSKPFYEVFVTLETAAKESFQAKWKPSKACEDYMDDDGRVLSKKLAETVIAKVSGKAGVITNVTQAKKKQAPPLPYNLSTLQIDAAKRFGLSAKQVLDVCQTLYERHKLITYPRSDCRYLPLEHYSEAAQVTSAIAKTCNNLSKAVSGANLSLKTKAWNDSKVSAHHAIIPTMKAMSGAALSRDEANVYELIARQYLIQFYPPFEYADKQIDSEVGGGLFIAKQKDVLKEGWKALFPKPKTKSATKGFNVSSPATTRGGVGHSQGPQDTDAAGFSNKTLPTVNKGDSVLCTDADLAEKQTSPPKHFTDATLLGAMTGIARYVSDPAIKKVLRETDGIGTEATRAGIIELLFSREFLTRKGKEIRATNIGIQLITSLPDVMGHPDMTAHWESQLEAISQRQMKYGQFMQPMVEGLNQLIDEVSAVQFQGLQGLGKSPFKKRGKGGLKNWGAKGSKSGASKSGSKGSKAKATTKARGSKSRSSKKT
ncbi:DNA topoisomerase III [Leucothrix pacifica]|uniref:DNA topoisomerase n=1 Tax=Leucothrix pacifica TaxID=1247513 RepID=A0A317C1X0_9GAMM|nr:DNA topoisomerase III [Leucothrix pacifica]PWQ92357.1 DNA topoisomerase III [Leucothrix pacifica]